ncbi:MBL fold metallo-hydrolase [Ruegeria sp. 2205SS24-7]|uniref:MBL fold metallo-hydrolase n=1 Tax=Ruegeria discodermiae TaxID=3064389 RepID=UPI0027414169|nr:MBL fold metallo-hydrolase [Ruegeria sp. 2205SS24-7]MDP5220812.1 MBL fold metallo-hydrolase [Ruegeria sp. 2205SS24-7]
MGNPELLTVAENWFQIDRADEFGVRRVREPHANGGSIWLVEGSERYLLVDTGIGVAPLRGFLQAHAAKPIVAFASVGYYDHAGGLHQFDERLIHENDAWRVRDPNRKNTVLEFYFDQALRALPHSKFDPNCHEMTACEPTRLLKDGDLIDLGSRSFEVLHLPGVTEGTCGLFERETGVLFTGEALVWNGTDVYDGEPGDRSTDADNEAFCASINRLKELLAAQVYPGHGDRQDAAIMKQVINNYMGEQKNIRAPES